ncbi:MAG: RhuM family protein [bacterium]
MKKENKNIGENLNKSEIVIYQDKDKRIFVDAVLDEDTVWLNLDQMSVLFDRDKSVISRHIKNIFVEKELSYSSVVANFATTAADGKTYKVDYYNLDIIISVGYRVKSKNGVSFRIWATKTLKDHIIKGYTLNADRLEEIKAKQFCEFEQAVGLIKKTIETRQLSGGEESGLLKVITEYTNSWLLLQKYDEDGLFLPKKAKKSSFSLEYDFALKAISNLKQDLIKKGEASALFGTERSSLQGIIGNIYQTFGGSELYLSIEEKAAHLLYFIIKDHPFSDGNKRIGSFLFIVFLAQNKHLLKSNGDKKINDNALVAIALLVAESDPLHKDTLIKLITNLIID